MSIFKARKEVQSRIQQKEEELQNLIDSRKTQAPCDLALQIGARNSVK